jgi:hypothetical protein
MENETTLTYIGGSWYARIPAGYTEHLQLSDKDKAKGSTPGMIKDEVGDKGKYVSIWKKGT